MRTNGFSLLVENGRMAEHQDKKDRTYLAVGLQVAAMGASEFQLGLLKYDDDELPMKTRVYSAETLLDPNTIRYLRLENSQDRNINIVPHGPHSLTLLDDITFDTITRMKTEGFQPAVVVETSPKNFQAWLQHGEILAERESSLAARLLAQRFNADRSSASWCHYGRLAGFTNRKPKYRNPATGYFPFVRLHEHSGVKYDSASEFLREVRAAIEREEEEFRRKEEASRSFRWTVNTATRSLTITDFRNRPEYGGDGNRIDMAYANWALDHGIPEHEVRSEIATRDLSKKGGQRGQKAYLDRTIKAAYKYIARH
jgi:RepB DNA-primase from phage plasmid